MKDYENKQEVPEFEPIKKALENLPSGAPPFSEDWFQQQPRTIAFPSRSRPLKRALIAASLLFTAGIAYFIYGFLNTRPPVPPATETAGRMIVVLLAKGKITMNRNGQSFPVSTGSTLRRDDLLLAANGASVDLLLPDRSLIRLRGEGELKLLDVDRNIRLRQEKGETFHAVMPSQERQSYRIETPTAIAGVRGTRFEVRISGTSTQVTVADGRVLMAPPEGAHGFEPVEVRAGESGAADPGTEKIEKKTAKFPVSLVIFDEMEQSRRMMGQVLLDQVSGMKDTAEQAEIEKIYNRPLETLVLADGKVLKGVVASQVEGKLILHTTEGVIVVPVEDLIEIRYEK